MWKTLQFVENVLDSVDQTAASTLKKGQTQNLSEFKKQKVVELEKKIEEYKKQNPEGTNNESDFLKLEILEIYEKLKDFQDDKEEVLKKMKEKEKEIKTKETYISDMEKRLENQISSLLKEKNQIETQYSLSIESKEKRQKELENQLKETIQQLKQKDDVLSKMRNEKEDLRNEIHKVEDLQTGNSIQLKDTISKLNFELKSQQENFKQFKNKSEKRESSLLEEKSNFENELLELNNSLNSKMNEIKRLNEEMTLRENEWKTKKIEFDQYKNRALEVFKSKDEEIQKLKTNSEMTNTEEKEQIDNGSFILELENLKSENQDLKLSIELLKRQYEAESISSKVKIKNLEQSLQIQKENVSKVQSNFASFRINSDESNQKTSNEIKKLSKCVQEKEQIISDLEKKVQKQNLTKPENEFEDRIKAMTEHLIEKQSHLETLKSEKSALLLQLEKENQKVKDIELMSRMNPNKRSNEFDYDPIESSVPMKTTKFFHDLSNRGWAANKVAVFMHNVDKFSLSSGTYLRKLPILRVLFVLYIILIHIWVIFVLYFSHQSVEHNRSRM
eukprot:gene3827-6988_t